jgi:hypothetical protein
VTEENRCIKMPLLTNILGDVYEEPPLLVETARIITPSHPAVEAFRRAISQEAHPVGTRAHRILVSGE